MIIDRGIRRALGAGGADVILAQHFEHGGSRQPHDQRRAAEAHRGGRNREHHECVPEALRLLAVDRNRAELGDEHHQDQKPEPECRHRQSAQAHHAQEIIEPGVLLDRADHPERNPEQDRERQRQRRELGGDRDARQDLVERRPLRHVGIAEVAVQQPADPDRVLHRNRLVEAELALDLGLLGRIDQAGGVEQDVGDVAGNQAEQRENDHRDPEQRQEHEREAPHQIG